MISFDEDLGFGHDDGRWGLISSFYTICWAAEYARNKRSKGLPSAHKCASGFSQDAKEIEMRLLLSHSWISCKERLAISQI